MRKRSEEQGELSYKKKISCIFRNRNLLCIDVLIIILAYIFSILLVKNIYEVADVMLANLFAIIFTVIMFVGVLFFLNMYRIMWVFAGTKDYIRFGLGCLLAAIPSAVFDILIYNNLSFKVYICAMVIASALMITVRMFVRGIHNLYSSKMKIDKNSKRLMIVGAGTSAALVLKDLASNRRLNYNVICFIDDDPSKKNAIINGIRVLGNRNDIVRLAELLKIDEIMLTMPSATVEDKKAIIEICSETDCSIKTMPSMDQMLHDGTDVISQIRNVRIEDLLAREPVKLDNKGIRKYIENQTVLVTGGGGSIGSELCRQIMKYDPKKLVILDIYENNAYDLQVELNRKYPGNNLEVVIASVRDKDRLEDIFKRYRPYVVFHAAAHKHVPLMEFSPGEAIKNNVFGTLNLVRCSEKYEVKRFVMISTDKAVNPTNVMGATKRICEMIVQAEKNNSKTEFICVRFGNVLGSNGSVIPLFKRQIGEGGPVTVTDKRITRFFMTIPEAAQLVLQAASYAKGGEIFALDMGQPVKIYDLAKNLIKLSGFKPDVDIKIVECGLRPGEKLYEELLSNEEGLTNTSHNKIFIGKQIDIDRDKLMVMLDKLKEVSESDDIDEIKDVIAEVVPTYMRKGAKRSGEASMESVANKEKVAIG